MDAAERTAIVAKLKKRSTGDLSSFFAAQGYGKAWNKKKDGWGRAARITDVLTEADAADDGDRLLADADSFFGGDQDLDPIEHAASAPTYDGAGTYDGGPATTVNSITIMGDVIGSTIQQGVSRSSQRIDPTITHEERGDVEAFIGAVTRARQNDELELDGEDEADLDSQLSTLQDQLRSPRPSRTIIAASFSIIGALLLNIAGNALYDLIPAWLGIG